MNTPRLPQTDSIQELAEFWDMHDVTDYEEELAEVREPVFVSGADIVVQLETDAAQAVRDLAASRGVPEAALIREWVLERIHAG
jgi:hypothetical protein